MSKIQIISDKNSRSSNIKRSLIKILKKNSVKKTNLTIVIFGFLISFLSNILINDLLMFDDLLFLSEII